MVVLIGVDQPAGNVLVLFGNDTKRSEQCGLCRDNRLVSDYFCHLVGHDVDGYLLPKLKLAGRSGNVQ
ncbi:hypothetical protein D3C73_907960 [compost metagenome]